MVRISKQAERRSVSRRRPSLPAKKTGALKQERGYNQHPNALEGEAAAQAFIPKIR